jgi:hypothetical protein
MTRLAGMSPAEPGKAPIRDGELIRPRMGADGGYHTECCDCGLVHKLDFSITPENGLELRVYRDQEKTFNARRDAASLSSERKR